jgi:hypothetical protein
VKKVFHTTMSSSEWRQEQAWCSKRQSLCGIAQLAIQNEACGQSTMRTTHF